MDTARTALESQLEHRANAAQLLDVYRAEVLAEAAEIAGTVIGPQWHLDTVAEITARLGAAGGRPVTDTPPPTLTERIADALRTVAHSCGGTGCRATEDECEAAHPVRRPEPWRRVVRIEGSPEGLAAAALSAVQAELDRIPILEERVSRVTAVLDSADDLPARIARQALAEEDRLRAELAALTEAVTRFTALMETDMETDDISDVLAAIRAAETAARDTTS
ncbi:hypothetical protein ACIQC7_35190 [Kitasatospora sp. NPDC088556]|uniref:hypothetical protein n=1 Tax=Kitasatospora sp. NPDC088556 TaxID=3364076 RepID=UPI003820DD72